MEESETGDTVRRRLPFVGARPVELGTSGKWHGANCYIRTFDGDMIEVRENVFEIIGLIKSAQETKP